MIALMNRIYLYCKLYQFYRHIHPLDNSCWWRHPQALYHVKVKLHEPGLDWQSIWKMSWTRGLSSDQTSFLFQLLHQLPTQNKNPESWTRTMEAVPCNNWGSAPTSFQFPWQQSCWRYIYSVVVTPGITPHDPWAGINWPTGNSVHYLIWPHVHRTSHSWKESSF